MADNSRRLFSWKWMFLSLIVFVGVELLLGGVVADLVRGRVTSISLSITIRGVLNLASYFIGGLIIGAISPGLRLLEPALGAFLSVTLMLGLSLFTPFTFIQFSVIKMLVGGAIAFCLALLGARLGEKLTGHRVP